MAIFTNDDSILKNSEKPWSYSNSDGDTLRFEVRGGDYYDNPLAPDELDDLAQGKNRSEITSIKKMQPGRAFTLEYDFLIESGAPNTASWLVLTQFHQTADTNSDGTLKDSGGVSPPFAVRMRGEYLEISGRTDPDPVTVSTPDRIALPPYDTVGGGTMYLDSNPIARDTWINLRIEIVFDHTVGGDGMLKVWRDGAVIVDYHGPLGYNDEIGPYLQMGVYREAAPETFAARFRNLSYTGDGTPPPINGTDGNDDLQAHLVGFYEDEVLNGYGGDDTLNGAIGADTMNGGAGNDEYIVDNVGDVVNEREGGVDQGGHDIVKSMVGWTLNDDIEDLRLQGTDDIDGTGNAKANRLQGNDGNNILRALDGDDTVLAAAGNDLVEGGAGNDTIHGETGNDTLHGGDGNDEVYGGDGDDKSVARGSIAPSWKASHSTTRNR